ncbi:sulfurtransferase TusA family protein [Marinobacter oulmenensis]|uniref:TusA-related sulfurtransferase n=1 Tax=Marinobacter oulmenensis TaxID=643747 RepID=A0A840U719_9GAMM|nr:sulfurtransferase TusA family protein [Marinobacter oulmenensis]MBB5320742.1 TusA-related sulfurtransferase [Marinobacter oulmenensis]
MAERVLDASGLRCPMPLLKTKLELNGMSAGERLQVIATDAGSSRDIPAWVDMSAHALISQSEDHGEYRFVIECGG